MPLVKLDNVSKSYEANLVLSGISWQISAEDRVGLIGSNGSGKTTLLQIITAKIQPSLGRIERAKKVRVGYLTQEPDLDPNLKLREQMLNIFAEVQQLELEMQKLAELMDKTADQAEIKRWLKDYSRLQEEHELAGGYSYEHRIDAVLNGLGFSREQFELPVGIFSGGEKSRAALAQLLLQQPDLLLLDEPTNHLDINAVEWLEEFLSIEYKGAFVVVSHDRYFLDKVVKKIVEIQDKKIYEYPGNYSKHLEIKALNLLTQQREYKKQQAFIEHEEDFIRRNIYGQRSKEVQGRQKLLDRLERVEKPKSEPKKMNIEFTPELRGGNDILQVRDLIKFYDDRLIFKDLSFDVYRQERIGIMGDNGTGKTTLLKVILGQESPTSGSIKLGANLRFGYYDQEHLSLNLENTLIDEIWELIPNATQQEVRSFLARFLFSGDTVFKKISELSGGEQSRMMLAKLLLQNANVLLLDEPTNHLDILAREVLEAALLDYSATIFVVSHDRYFLNKVATKMLVFKADTAKLWDGNYSTYEQAKHVGAHGRAPLQEETAGKEQQKLAQQKQQEKVGTQHTTPSQQKKNKASKKKRLGADEKAFYI